MIEMGMREQQKIDRSRIEAEGFGVLLPKLASALEQTAIDQDSPPGALDEMAGAGYAPVGAVKRYFHNCLRNGCPSYASDSNGLPLRRYQ